jgi:endonuclease/exonuclease/phosphatase family metal-dependent hydrolase
MPTLPQSLKMVSRAALAALLVSTLGGPALAADRTIAGKRLTVVDPDAGDSSRRSVTATAREDDSPESVAGDPTLALGMGGAVLELVANGANPSWQLFGLAQGVSSSGRPFWRPVPAGGYRYRDRRGEQGPVRAVRIGKNRAGAFLLRAKLRAGNATVDVVPPDPGTDGLVALSLSVGDRYCAQYGPESQNRNHGARRWSVGRPQAEGCASPPQATGEFLALSYNVAGLPEGISGSHPETNTPIISPLLNGYDLVVVQESWQTPDPNPLAPLRVYHELLVADATHAYKTVPAPQPLGGDPRRPLAVVSDGLNMLSRFPFSSLQREMWNGCADSAADCLSQKGFMVTRTTFAPGVTVDVYNLHMEAGGDPADDQLRDEGVTQLATFMNAFSAGRPVIVGGDFNLHTNEEPDSTQFQRLLAETGVSDVCATLACPEPGRIDKFLFRSSAAIDLAPLSWRFETDIFQDPEGEPLSDHDPLAVRFRWTVQ